MNDIISTFNDLYYKIQISHNICLADVRNICLKSYNNSVVCDVDGGAPEIYYEILERDCGHFAVLKIERNSQEIIYESVNADFAAIALFLFLSRHQIKKTDNDIEIEEFIKKLSYRPIIAAFTATATDDVREYKFCYTSDFKKFWRKNNFV